MNLVCPKPPWNSKTWTAEQVSVPDVDVTKACCIEATTRFSFLSTFRPPGVGTWFKRGPFKFSTVLHLSVLTLLPVLPLMLTTISPEELIDRLLKIVL